MKSGFRSTRSTFGLMGEANSRLCTIHFIITCIFGLFVIVHSDSRSTCDVSSRVNITAVYSYRDPSSGEIRVCLKCPPGSYRKGQCTSVGSLNHCHCCPDNSFKFTYDNATSCQICKGHCYDHYEVKTDECTRVSDIKCQCRSGYFKNREHCYEHSPCPLGQGVKTPGTPFKDTECEDCIAGETYNNVTSATDLCSNCTRCRTGEAVVHKCSQTSNTVCENDHGNDYTWIAAPVVIGIAIGVVAAILLFFWYRQRKSPKKRAKDHTPEGEIWPIVSANMEPLGSISNGLDKDENKQLFRMIFVEISKECDSQWLMFIRSLPGNPVEEGDINAIIDAWPKKLHEQIYRTLWKYIDNNPEVTPENFCEYLNTSGNGKYHELTKTILQKSKPLSLNGHHNGHSRNL